MLSPNVERILSQRYYKPGENWDMLVERVVQNVCEHDSSAYKDAARFYIGNRIFLPNSPCLVNAGTKSNGLFACFVMGPTEDTLEDGFSTLLDIAKIAKSGGGCGFTGSVMRPKNSPVAGSAHGYSYGPNRYAELVSFAMDMMTQSGFRKMALMYTLDVNHKDIDEFINLKQTANEAALYNFNQSVFMDDAFIKRAINNPVSPEYRMLEKIALHAWNNGEPGILFADTINNNTPYKYTGQKILATNPCGEQPLPSYGSCLSGDTLILTNGGIKKMSDSVTQDYTLTRNGLGDSVITPYTHINQGKKFTIVTTLDGGLEITTTPDHIFMTDIGEVRADELIESGARIKWMKNNPFNTKKTVKSFKDEVALMLGWMHADGWMTTNTIGISFNNNDGDFEIMDRILETYHVCFGNRTPLKNDNVSYQEQTDAPQYTKIINDFGIVLGSSLERELPTCFYRDFDLNQQLLFLSALFTGDAGVGGKAKSQIHFATSSKKFAVQIQEVLSALGIQTRRYKTDFVTNRNPQYKIIISKESALKFMEYIGFLTEVKTSKFNSDADKHYTDSEFLEVISQRDGEEMEVFDLSVPSTHTFYANGILVHNCNLGSINLAHAYFFERFNEFDYERLEEVTRFAVRFLDNVGSKNKFPTERLQKWYEENRPIGLGVMGLADAMLHEKIRYGSADGENFTAQIMGTMFHSSYDESSKLGVEKGVPINCQKVGDATGHYRRNITTISIAPTGSIAFIAECSHGIEPIFSPSYVRIDERGEEYTFVHPLRDEKYFVAAVGHKNSPSWREQIDLMATVQKFCDSGISKTINLEENVTPQEVLEAYIYSWMTGCKGITVYRNNSRTIQVLNHKEEIKEDKIADLLSEIIKAEDIIDSSCPTGVCSL